MARSSVRPRRARAAPSMSRATIRGRIFSGSRSIARRGRRSISGISLDRSSYEQRNARNEQQHENEFSKLRLVQPPIKSEAEPKPASQRRQSDDEEPGGIPRHPPLGAP